jgi:hypothetical protein
LFLFFNKCDNLAESRGGGGVFANISRFGFDYNLSFMVSYKTTERKVVVRSIGWYREIDW